MSFIVKAALLFLLGAQSALATSLDDYVWAPDANFKWEDMVNSFLQPYFILFHIYVANSTCFVLLFRVLSTLSEVVLILDHTLVSCFGNANVF